MIRCVPQIRTSWPLGSILFLFCGTLILSQKFLLEGWMSILKHVTNFSYRKEPSRIEVQLTSCSSISEEIFIAGLFFRLYNPVFGTSYITTFKLRGEAKSSVLLPLYFSCVWRNLECGWCDSVWVHCQLKHWVEETKCCLSTKKIFIKL